MTRLKNEFEAENQGFDSKLFSLKQKLENSSQLKKQKDQEIERLIEQDKEIDAMVKPI